MSNKVLQQELKQALKNKDTALVYDLYKKGADLKAFKIWGLIKPSEGWSTEKRREVDANIKANPDHYFLTMESSKFWQDEEFTSQFLVSEQDKLVLKAKKKDIQQIIRENDLKSFRDYLDKLKGPKGLYILINNVVPEVICSKNTAMYKLAYPKITTNAALDNCFRAAWDIRDSKIFSDLLKKIKDPKSVEYYCERFLKLDTPKRIKQLEDDIKPKQYLRFYTEPLDVHREMFAQFLKRSSKETKEGLLLSHYVKNNNNTLFEVLFPKVTDQKALGKALKSAVELKNYKLIDKIMPRVTDQRQLGEALFLSLSDDRASIFDKILPRLTDKSVLNDALKLAKLKKQLNRGDEPLKKVNARILEVKNMSIDNKDSPTPKVKSVHSR